MTAGISVLLFAGVRDLACADKNKALCPRLGSCRDKAEGNGPEYLSADSEEYHMPLTALTLRIKVILMTPLITVMVLTKIKFIKRTVNVITVFTTIIIISIILDEKFACANFRDTPFCPSWEDPS